MQDHYKTLGVKRDATDKQIKEAYRDKATELHPDKQGGDERLFKALSTSYTLLIDSKRRKFYDETGSSMKGSEFDRKAGALLQQLFQMIVTDNGLEAIIHLDIIPMIGDQIDRGMGELEKKVEHSKGSKEVIDNILKRLKHKNKRNPITLMLKHESTKHSELITQKKQEMEVGKRAWTMLKEYDFDFEEQMQSTGSYTSVTFMQT